MKDKEIKGNQDYEEAKTPVQVNPKDESIWEPEEPTFFDNLDEEETQASEKDPYK